MAQEPHLRYQTQYTRTGQLDMKNKKPYRTTANKAKAQQVAELIDGTYKVTDLSKAPLSYHK